METHFFSKIAKDSHPAVKYAIACLDSIVHKNLDQFAASFERKSVIFANLPGGVQVTSVQKFVEMHRAFFASSTSRFSYGDLQQGVGGADFFTCSIPAHVILPNGAERDVYIDMTLILEEGTWVPIRFINTVVDSKQIVIE